MDEGEEFAVVFCYIEMFLALDVCMSPAAGRVVGIESKGLVGARRMTLLMPSIRAGH